MSQPFKKVQPTANPSGKQRRMHSGSVPGVGSMGVPTTSTGPHAANLDTLRKIAEATPAGDWEPRTTGPWHGDHWYVSSGGEHVAMIAAQDGINEDEREPLATHIATFDPPTVLALLSRLEQAEQAVSRVREVVANLEDHFRPRTAHKFAVAENLRRALDGDTRG